MGKIVLSYRWDDAPGYAGRLTDDLRDTFGDAAVFRDVDTVAPGVDFVKAISKAVGESDVFLAVIGRRWLTCRGSDRRKRIDDPDDYVRLEITTALELGRKVIPVLVDGASVPKAKYLPVALRPLVRHNAIELTDERWSYDVGRLIAELPEGTGVADPAEQALAAPSSGHRRRLPRRRVLVPFGVGALSLFLLIATLELLAAGGGPSSQEVTPIASDATTTSTVSRTEPTLPSTPDSKQAAGPAPASNSRAGSSAPPVAPVAPVGPVAAVASKPESAGPSPPPPPRTHAFPDSPDGRFRVRWWGRSPTSVTS